jgi:hypothetical protein
MAITLSEFIRAYQQQTNSYNFKFNNNLLQNLNLLVKQKRLGLNIEPLLKNNPDAAEYLLQLEQAIPHLFNSRKKVYLNQSITAKLPLNHQDYYWIETKVNLAFTPTKYLLITWSFNKFQLGFKHRANLWAICKFLKINPTKLNLIHYFLTSDWQSHCVESNRDAIRTIYRWDSKQQKETQKLLKQIGLKLVNNNFIDKNDLENKSFNKIGLAREIESLEEIKI